ncbi:uncharacterized protein K452DRAFT_231161, partial [Aplosporella prunicola CBS 121167]
TMSTSTPADKPRLTEEEKKSNHIASEQKRRQAIRQGFDRLASIVPGMEGQGRSEAIVLEATVKYLKEQYTLQQKLVAQIKARGIDLSDLELPEGYLEAIENPVAQNLLAAEDDHSDDKVI